MRNFFKPLAVLLLLLGSICTNAQEVSFTLDNIEGCAPLTVTATNTSTIQDPDVVYDWYIDDIKTAYVTPLVKIFNKEGDHKIKLKAYDGAGAHLGTSEKFITVHGGTPTIKVFPGKDICPGEEVKFELQNFHKEISWDFGNGMTSSYNHTPVTYKNAGTYTAKVTYQTEGCGEKTAETNVTVGANASPTPMAYLYGKSDICPNDLVIVEGASQHYEYEWTITPENKVLHGNRLEFAFSEMGEHQISYKVKNICGNTAQVASPIRINVNANTTPFAEFEIHPAHACPNTPVHFETKSSGAVKWEFPDGFTTDEKHFEYFFPTEGIHTVSMTVVNGCGLESPPHTKEVTIQKTAGTSLDIFAEARLNKEFIDPQHPICTGTEIELIGMGEHREGLQYTWTIAPVNSPTSITKISDMRDTKYVLSSAGDYEITLKANDPCGASGEAKLVVSVKNNAPPKVELRFTPQRLCPEDYVYFYDDKNNLGNNSGIKYYVDFGDGSAEVGPITEPINLELNVVAEHAYAAGNYTAKFKAVSACGGETVLDAIIDAVEDPNHIPPYYVSNSTAQDMPPQDNNLPPNWKTQGGAEDHKFNFDVEMPNFANTPTATAYALFWLGTHDLNGDVPKPDGILPITLTDGIGAGSAFVPTNIKDNVTIAVAYYCGDAIKIASEPDTAIAVIDPGRDSYVYPLTVSSETSLTKQYLNGPYPSCKERKLTGIWETTVSGKEVILEINTHMSNLLYKISENSGTGFNVFETGHIYLEAAPDDYMLSTVSTSPCSAAANSGTYTITQSADGLTLTKLDDACTDRSTLLSKPFTRSQKPKYSPATQRILGDWYFENSDGIMFHLSFWNEHKEHEGIVKYRMEIKGNETYDEPANGIAKVASYDPSGGDGQIVFGTTEPLPGGGVVDDSRCPQIAAQYSLLFTDIGLKFIVDGADECAKRHQALSGKNFIKHDPHHDVCPGGEVKFKAVGGQSYEWHFGDANNTTSTKQYPVFSYSTAGFYDAYVKITNNCGRTDEIHTPVTIKPTARVSSDFGLKYDRITIDQIIRPEYWHYSHENDKNTYLWDFGDGTKYNTREVDHAYALPGEYEISLTVSNACGTSTQARRVYVEESLEEYCKANFKVTVDNANLTVALTNTSFNSTSSEWIFEEFANPIYTEGSASPPSYTYPEAGEYPITLNIFNEETECADQITIPVHVGEIDQNCFVEINPIVNSTNLSVDFKVKAPASLTNWYWMFSDLQSSEKAPVDNSFVKQFDKPGIYTVNVLAWDDANCDISKEIEIKVGEKECDVVAEFSYFPDHANKTLVLKSESTGNANRFFWRFGDGEQKPGRLAKHVYPEAGTYFVTLVARDSVKKCGDKIGKFIKIGENACRAAFDFKVDPTTNAVTFENLSTNGDLFFWDFGDNNFSEEQSPSHTYDEPGIYFVHLVAINSVTGVDHDVEMLVHVGSSDCEAYFEFEANGKTVSFEDKSIGTAETTKYLWLFDDGSEKFGEKNPEHTYKRGGNFEVTLLIGDEQTGCFAEYSQLVELEMEEHFVDPKFAYRADYATRTVKFINKTTPIGGNYTYKWNFNDGETSTASDPEHTFPQGKNVFRVSLTVGVDKDNDQEPDIFFTKHRRVIVGEACVADFTYTKDEAKPNWAQCTNTSTVNSENATYLWRFNGEGSSTEKDPDWKFKNSEPAWVFLGVQDGTCKDFTIKIINSSGESGLACGFFAQKNATSSKKPSGHPTDFYGASYGGSSLSWNFGDGSSSEENSLNPTHTYEEPGVYNVTLTVTDPITGEEAEYTQQVMVNGAPVANAGQDQIVTEGGWITLDGSGTIDETTTGTLTYTWTAPEGITLDDASLEKPKFESPDIAVPTQYTFTLVVSDGEYQSVEDQITVTVNPINDAPIANAGEGQTVTEGETVTLDGSGSSDPNENAITYTWTAPEGITLDDANAVKPTFTTPDIQIVTDYVFKLTVNDGEAETTAEVTIKVNPVNDAPTANAGADQTVNNKDVVTLDGSASTDPNENTITYKWTAPEGITLSDPNAEKPTFTAPVVGTSQEFKFTLVVNDGTVNSEVDEMIVTVTNVTSIEGVILESFKISPNPASTFAEINFSLKQTEKVNLSVYDLSGKLIEKLIENKRVYDNHKVIWRLNGVKQGNYILKLATSKGSASKLLFVK